MSSESPYEKLGVKEDASFEEIQAAKKRSIEQSSNDSKVVDSIEAAYDAIIMERLKLRQEGKIKVPERIRFPEQSYETPSKLPSIQTNNTPGWLKSSFDRPSKNELLASTGVYLVLIVAAIFERSLQGSMLPLLMALGFGANIYFLNRKERRFGRAVLISLIGLLVGVVAGSGLSQLLDTQLDTISLETERVASVFTLFLFWIFSSFLR